MAVAGFGIGSAFAQEIGGPCSQAVGTFLTANTLERDGRRDTSRSLLALTNGGHAIRFDSDETGSATNHRTFGDSAGTWRCDDVDDDGTVYLTATMLDFTYPGADGEPGQIVRLDLSGRYTPDTGRVELAGTLGFLPITADAQEKDALKDAPGTVSVSLSGTRIELPPPSR